MGLLSYISYVAGIAAFAFVTLSLASGLLYISELIEEHSQLAKTVGKRGLYVVILLHVLLFFFDSLPFKQTAFSIICHVVYLQNFSNSWPLISLLSPSFIASCILVLADHFAWFFYFERVTREARHYRSYLNPPSAPGFFEIASFFSLCVWLVPLFLFLSLSANDNTLPMSAADPGTASGSGFAQAPHTRTSLIRSMFALFSFDLFPRVRQKNSEGLIAPPSPKIPPQSPVPTSPMPVGSPRLPHSPVMSSYAAMSPPRSPGSSAFRNREFEANLANLPMKPDFKLAVPPNRRPGIIARRQTNDGSTAGKRHVT